MSENNHNLSDEEKKKIILERCKGHKRPEVVAKYMLEHDNCITTDEIQELGYDHPPRAARDIRELGIPLKTTRTTGENGKSIAKYSFDIPDDFNPSQTKVSGRKATDNKIKEELIKENGCVCSTDNMRMRKENLQIDHRVPYEIGGEYDDPNPENYQLLSASANRQKSWACEHCPNWKDKKVEVCETCFWAHPDNHEHIACESGKTIIITLRHGDANDEQLYQEIQKLTNGDPEKIKEILAKCVEKREE